MSMIELNDFHAENNDRLRVAIEKLTILVDSLVGSEGAVSSSNRPVDAIAPPPVPASSLLGAYRQQTGLAMVDLDKLNAQINRLRDALEGGLSPASGLAPASMATVGSTKTFI